MNAWKPPREVQEAAAKGLDLRQKHNRGGTEVGVARARDLSNGREVSAETVLRMVSYFARHEVDKQGRGWADDQNPSAGYVAWLLWGGDAGRAWAKKIAAKIEEDDEMQNRAAPVLLNRSFEAPADGFYQVVPMGEWPVRLEKPDGKVETLLQVVDAPACEAMANRFREAAAAAGEQFAGILVDYDHFSQDTDKSSEAAGWITAIENRADGLYAQIRWTDRGEAAVKGGRYRYLSPVWNRADTEELGGGRVRPLRLHRAAVTNDPNMRGIRPLTNRAADAGAGSQPEGEKTMPMPYKDVLCNMLGLPADATDEQIQNAMDAAKSKATKDKADSEAMCNRATTAEARVAELQQAELNRVVEADLVEFAPVIQNRDEVKAQLLANREPTRKILAAMKPAAAALPTEPLRNRAEATPPAPAVVPDAAAARAKAQADAALELIRNRSATTFNEAFALAATQQPELFR